MRVVRRGAFCVAALWLAACTQAVRVDTQSAPFADSDFAVAGRLSARHGDDALTGSFDWRHRQDADAITLSSPLGQVMATLARSDGAVSMTLADGRRAQADTFEALTAQAFGVPLPVSGLTYWIRGQPHAGAAFAVERDAASRANVLRQDGWEIVYSYADDTALLPRRLTLAYPGIDMRVVVDRWQ